jgi:mono/diheme cytochrome c family protein
MRSVGQPQNLSRGLVLVAVLSMAGLGGAAQSTTLPEGTGAGIVKAKCLGCHEADMIAGQKLTKTGWTREIDKMVRWGAVVTEAERDPLVDYLAAHFAPAPAASHARAAEGEAVFKRACLSCHGADMTEGQRLTHTGWTREVEKMVRWGATVSDPDKAALVDYLATRFGPR